jgi:predicted nucleic acid-binding protein
MPRVTYDTNIFIKEKPANFPAGFFMSAIVIQELAAGASDGTRLKDLGSLAKSYEKEGRLLVPNGEDWWFAGKILNSLYKISNLQRKASFAIPTIEQQRILRDVLIARTAKRAGVVVVTSNLKDFEKIQAYCAVKVQHPKDFF